MNLTERQTKIKDCLFDFKQSLQNGIVTNLREISGKHSGVSNKIDLVLKNLDLIKKNGHGGYVWSDDQDIDDDLVLDIEGMLPDPEATSLVKSLLEHYKNEGEKYPVPFEQVWWMFGYYDKKTAKDALNQWFTLGDDFILLGNNPEVSRENIGSRGPLPEMLRLSWPCFMDFLSNAQTKKVKFLRRKINEAIREHLFKTEKSLRKAKAVLSDNANRKVRLENLDLVCKKWNMLKTKQQDGLLDDIGKGENQISLFSIYENETDPIKKLMVNTIFETAQLLEVEDSIQIINPQLTSNENQHIQIAQA